MECVMDIARPEIKRQKRRRQIIWSVVALIVLVGVTVGISRLKPAAPTVDRSTIWTDTVKRGSMLRQVRGLGSLIPSHEDVRRNLANIFVTGDQGAEAAHLAQHGTALHGVGPDGAAVDGRGGRLQARDAHRDSYQHDQRDNRPDDLAAALLTFNFGTGDIHYALHCASGEPLLGTRNYFDTSYLQASQRRAKKTGLSYD